MPVGLAAFDGLAAIIDGPFTAINYHSRHTVGGSREAINLYQHSTDADERPSSTRSSPRSTL